MFAQPGAIREGSEFTRFYEVVAVLLGLSWFCCGGSFRYGWLFKIMSSLFEEEEEKGRSGLSSYLPTSGRIRASWPFLRNTSECSHSSPLGATSRSLRSPLPNLRCSMELFPLKHSIDFDVGKDARTSLTL